MCAAKQTLRPEYITKNYFLFRLTCWFAWEAGNGKRIESSPFGMECVFAVYAVRVDIMNLFFGYFFVVVVGVCVCRFCCEWVFKRREAYMAKEK